MKLVDVLARELKEWPEGVVTAVQDLDGEVKFDNSHEMPRMNNSKDVWIRQGNEGDSLYPKELAEDCSYAIVTLPLWQAAVDALKAERAPSAKTQVALEEARMIRSEQVVEWNGEGLPPVGTVCESVCGGIVRKVEVLAVGKKNVFLIEGGEEKMFSIEGTRTFRPIRTPEQIAAEERELAINAMIDTLGHPTAILMRESILGALYDAGYRKF